MAIVDFAMTTSAYAAVLIMEFVANFTICVPAIVSIAACVDVREPFCSAIAETVWSAKTSAYADLPKICIFNFQCVVNAAVNINVIAIMELSFHCVITPAYIQGKLVVYSSAQKRADAEHVQ